MRCLLILFFAIFLSACRDDSGNFENRFEAIYDKRNNTAEKTLRACIDDPTCDAQGEAMASLGVSILTGVKQDECQWMSGQKDTLVPVAIPRQIGVSEKAPSLSLDEWVAQAPDQARSLVAEGSLFKPFQFDCDYDDQSPEFQEGHDLLVKAAAAGRKDAANDIGVIYINDPDMFDLAFARSVLEPCHAAGGGYCAFNLARIESLEDADGCGRCISLLRIAAARTEDKGVRFMFALAKSRLGRGKVVGRVFYDFDLDGGAQRYLVEFDMLFPNLVLKAGPKPPAP